MSIKPSASVAKGRAGKARPLACLLAVATALGALASPAAAARPEPPGLTGTNPPSPSTVTRPLVQGRTDGVVISSTRLTTAALGPVTRAQHPTYLITVYAGDQTCASAAAIVGQGTATELEGPGVQLSVDLPEDAETTLYATETDPTSPGEPSACSNGIAYQQVGSPPEPPTFSATMPASPGADDTPALIGAAAAHSTVSIYTDSACTGGAVATGTAAAFASPGIEAPAAENSTTTFYAKATLAGLESACSTSSITYQEVPAPPGEEPPPGAGPPGGGGGGEQPHGEEKPHEVVEKSHEGRPNPPGKPMPPRMRITPEGIANDDTPTVSGRAPGAVRVQVFDAAGCRGAPVAAGSTAQFDAGIPVRVAENSTVALYGVSVDGGGDHSTCPDDPVIYVEDSTPPHVRITSGPAPRTRRRTVQFTFVDASGDPSTSFFCRLDRRKWSPCRSPFRLGHLGHRRHTLAVRGVDAAGNVEKAGARRSFKAIRGG